MHQAKDSVRALAGRIHIVLASAFYPFVLLFRHAALPGSILLIYSVLSGVASPLIVWALAGLIDALTRVEAALVEPWPAVLPWFAVLSLAFLLRSIESAGEPYLANLAGLRLDTAIQRMLFKKAISMPLAAFEQPEYYTKLESGRKARGGPLISMQTMLSRSFSAGIGVGGLIFLYAQVHWLLAIVLCVTAVLRSVIGGVLSSMSGQADYRTVPLRLEQNYWTDLLCSREAAPEIRLFGVADRLRARWRHAFNRYLAQMTSVRQRSALYTIGGVALQELISLVMVFALLVLALRGAITIGSLVGLLYGLSRFRELAGSFVVALVELVYRWTHLAHLRGFLALPSESRLLQPRRVPQPLRQGVQFHNVSFTYPGAERPVLSNVTLTLGPKERVALVGENGSGKTTLVRLLLGLYRPSAGKITVDDVDLAAVDVERWRREATAVFQDYMRYLTTVGENIAYADVSLLGEKVLPLELSHPRIVAAATQSGVHPFIARLSTGYATPLGKEFEGGVELSSGQWQGLALARAYLRDAQLVVLDEPTAALDPRREVEVYRQFRNSTNDRCAVMITHRLGAAKLVDRIVVLREGRIVEVGEHQTLLSRNGEYARMYRLQAHWYVESAAAESSA